MDKGINRGALRLVSTALLAAVLMHRGAEASDLKVCVDKSSPTAQMDAALAQAVARVQGVTAQVSWFDGGSDDDDGLAPRVFRKMATTQCQLVLGFPLDAQSPEPPAGLRATRPYGHTGFVLVTRKQALTSLEQLPKGSTVAVTYMTAPNLYFENHPEISPEVFTSDAASLRALGRREVTAAMLWRPFVAGREHLGTMTITALSEPHASWNLVALYADAAQPEAKGFELAIEQLRQFGKLGAILQPYADPPEEPAVAKAGPVRQNWSGPRGRLIAMSDKKDAASKVPPGLFTAEQAEAGQQVFQQNCAMCHGPKLEGRAGPALKGPTFASPQAHFSVSDVFKIISLNMPAPAPGTLPQADYVNIMAFILQQNGYPPAATALTFEDASKSKVRLIYREAHAD